MVSLNPARYIATEIQLAVSGMDRVTEWSQKLRHSENDRIRIITYSKRNDLLKQNRFH